MCLVILWNVGHSVWKKNLILFFFSSSLNVLSNLWIFEWPMFWFRKWKVTQQNWAIIMGFTMLKIDLLSSNINIDHCDRYNDFKTKFINTFFLIYVFYSFLSSIAEVKGKKIVIFKCVFWNCSHYVHQYVCKYQAKHWKISTVKFSS